MSRQLNWKKRKKRFKLHWQTGSDDIALSIGPNLPILVRFKSILTSLIIFAFWFFFFLYTRHFLMTLNFRAFIFFFVYFDSHSKSVFFFGLVLGNPNASCLAARWHSIDKGEKKEVSRVWIQMLTTFAIYIR